MNKLNIIIATGGTGGHIFPARALAEGLTDNGYKISFVVDEKYKKFVPKNLDEVFEIKAASLSGGIVKKIFSLAKLLFATCCAIRILWQKKTGLVTGFGGYPAFPTCLAAMFLGIPYIIHEQNAVLGKANRYLAIRAKYIATSFDDTEGIPPQYKHKIIFTGNPVRKQIMDLSNAKKSKKSDEGRINLLVIGGSQGASSFSKIIPEALFSLPEEFKSRISITQQCRSEETAELSDKYTSEKINHEVAHFFVNIEEKLLSCDLVIARSGASTIAELGAVGKFAILVPLPTSAHNHQYINAKKFAETGNAILMLEGKDFNAKGLKEKLMALFESKKLFNSNAAPIIPNNSNATQNFIDLIKKAFQINLIKPGRD